MNKQRLKIFIASLIGALASFLPFYTVTGGVITNRNYISATMTGFDSIAVTTFVIFLIIIVMCLSGKRNQSFLIGGRIFLILLSLVNVYIIAAFLLGNAFASGLSEEVSNYSLTLANLNGELGAGFWIMFIMTFAIIFFSFAKGTLKQPATQNLKYETPRVIRE